jgi:4-alpha-glucanotransferase
MGGMTDLPASLIELARRYGVATEYQNWTGRHTTVADSTLIAVLDALGVPAATEDERTAALLAHDRDYWARSLPPAIVGRSGAASSFWVHVTHGDPVGLWIRLEDGSVRTGLRQLEITGRLTISMVG